MRAHEVPQELIDILNAQAGKVHRRDSPVIACLADILTKYEEIREEYKNSKEVVEWTLF